MSWEHISPRSRSLKEVGRERQGERGELASVEEQSKPGHTQLSKEDTLT